MKTILILALLLVPALGANAQQPDTKAQRAAMAELSFMLGSWIGPGWRTLPSGERVENVHFVHVASKGAGLVYTIEGRGVRQGSMAATPSDGSFAVIGYDEQAGEYFFNSYSFGMLYEAKGALIEPGVFSWRIDAGAPLRFIVDGREEGVWKEIGEIGTLGEDGEMSWRQTYEVTHYRTDSP